MENLENLESEVYNHFYDDYTSIKFAVNANERIDYIKELHSEVLTNLKTSSESFNIQSALLSYGLINKLLAYAFALNDVTKIEDEMCDISEKIDNAWMHSECFNAKTVEDYLRLINNIKSYDKSNYNEKLSNAKIDKFVNKNLKELPLKTKYEIKQNFSEYVKLSLINNQNKNLIQNTEYTFNKYCGRRLPF